MITAWEQRKLGDVATIVGGGTPSTNNDAYWDGEIDWYSPAELGERVYADRSVRRITQAGYDSCSATLLPAGKTILFTSRAGIGNTAILRRSACTNQGFQSLVVNDDIDVYFVYSMTDRIKKFAEQKASGSTFLEISGKGLAAGEFAFPSKDEQTAIGSMFKQLDNLITLHQRKCEYRSLCGYLSWEQRKFSDIADVCSGKDYKHLKEGPIPVYGTGGFMTSVDEALSYDRDAVGIGRKGTIDKPYLLKAPFWTVDTLFYAIPKEDMDLEFVHCSFLNVDWKSKDESTGLPSLSKEAINETIALVPSFNEQSRLGEFFNNLDSLITLHQ